MKWVAPVSARSEYRPPCPQRSDVMTTKKTDAKAGARNHNAR